MNPFWRLAGFEYRKMLRKKSIILGLILAFLLSLINGWGILIGNHVMNGEVFESNYEAMIKDRTYARSLAGRPVDTELILDASRACAQIPGSAHRLRGLYYGGFPEDDRGAGREFLHHSRRKTGSGDRAIPDE